MTNVNITNFRKNVYELLETAIKYNEQINISDIGDDIKVAYVEDISSEHFQASSLRKEEKIMSEQEEVNPIQTRRLYSIAEQFIKSISNLRNSA